VRSGARGEPDPDRGLAVGAFVQAAGLVAALPRDRRAVTGLVQEVLAMVKERGPIGAGTLERELVGDVKREKGTWWDRSDVKHICEYLFGIGELTTGTRRSFERLYDLTERVVPPEILNRTIDADECARQLIERSARASRRGHRRRAARLLPVGSGCEPARDR